MPGPSTRHPPTPRTLSPRAIWRHEWVITAPEIRPALPWVPCRAPSCRPSRAWRPRARSVPWQCARTRRSLSSVTAGLRPPARCCGGQERTRALLDQVAGELTEGCEQVAYEPAAGRGGVGRPGERAEPHSASLQRGHSLDPVRQVAAEPAEFPDDEHLGIAHGPETFAVGARARGAVLEHLFAPKLPRACQAGARGPGPPCSPARSRCGPWPSVSVFPSGNHRVRFPVRAPRLTDRWQVAGQR